MKIRILILVFGLIIFKAAYGQNNFSIDTIKVKKDLAVNLFFPAPIKESIKGSKYLLFKFDDNSKYGSVFIAPTKESNLTVITNDDLIYSFFIKYDDKVNKLNYFLKKEQAINFNFLKSSSSKENQVVTSKSKMSKNKPTKLYDDDKNAFFKRIALGLIDKPDEFKRKFVTVGKITFKLKDIVFNKNELYFILNLKNDSNLNYEVNYIKFFLSTIKKKNKTSLQDIELTPLYVFRFPKIIKGHESIDFVFVIDKITINKKKKIKIEVNEKNGERNLSLDIYNNYINNASKLEENFKN